MKCPCCSNEIYRGNKLIADQPHGTYYEQVGHDVQCENFGKVFFVSNKKEGEADGNNSDK